MVGLFALLFFNLPHPSRYIPWQDYLIKVPVTWSALSITKGKIVVSKDLPGDRLISVRFSIASTVPYTVHEIASRKALYQKLMHAKRPGRVINQKYLKAIVFDYKKTLGNKPFRVIRMLSCYPFGVMSVLICVPWKEPWVTGPDEIESFHVVMSITKVAARRT